MVLWFTGHSFPLSLTFTSHCSTLHIPPAFSHPSTSTSLSHLLWIALPFSFLFLLVFKIEVTITELFHMWELFWIPFYSRVILKSIHVCLSADQFHLCQCLLHCLPWFVCSTNLNSQGEPVLSGAGNTFQGLDPNNWTGNGLLIWANGKDNLAETATTSSSREAVPLQKTLTLNVPSASCHGVIKWIGAP